MKMLNWAAFAAAAIATAMGPTAVSAATLPNPRKVIAMIDGTQNFGTTKRSISFYDVSDITTNGNTNAGLGPVFGQSPLFSVFLGFEDVIGSGNRHDIDTIAINPVNGALYALEFDSGAENVLDGGGDTQGDLDIFRIDYQELLNDYVTNSRPMGTMYGPTIAANGQANPDHDDAGAATIHISNAITKVGEVGRTQGADFFDRDMEFVDPQTLVIMDNARDNGFVDPSTDKEIRVLERVSTATGTAVRNGAIPTSIEGGYNGQTAQSWHADRAALMNMDFDSISGLPIGHSEPEDMALAMRNGVVGVWIGETDGGGDDLGFFELTNISSHALDAVATLSSIDGLGNTRALDEDPEFDPNTNDGDHDFIKVDQSGRLMIGESGFFDTVPGGETGNGGPSGEPSFIRLNVSNYAPGNVTTTAGDTWDDLDEVDGFGPVGSDRAGDLADPPTQLEGPLGSLTNTYANPDTTGLGALDDDTAVTDGRFATYDPGRNLMYLFDIDSGAAPGVVADVYAIDMATGRIVYQELNATNHFLIEHGVRLFTRGDTNGDGLVNASDIDNFYDASTQAGASTLTQEMHDLDGDGDTDFIVNLGVTTSDSDRLIHGILGTQYGDANLDGAVNFLDASALSGGFGTAGGWAVGNFNGAGNVDFLDASVLSGSFGFDNVLTPPPGVGTGAIAGLGAVPEPSTVLLVLAGTGLIAGAAGGRRRK